MAPVLVISHIKDTYFFFYCMKMKLELMKWEGHESYSSAPLLALAELFVNPQCGLLNPFLWFCQSPDQHALSSLLIVNTIHLSRAAKSWTWKNVFALLIFHPVNTQFQVAQIYCGQWSAHIVRKWDVQVVIGPFRKMLIVACLSRNKLYLRARAYIRLCKSLRMETVSGSNKQKDNTSPGFSVSCWPQLGRWEDCHLPQLTQILLCWDLWAWKWIESFNPG